MYFAVPYIFGQALLFGHSGLLEYAAAVWIGFHMFIVFYEEPVLRRAYGVEYEGYCRDVHRWIPRGNLKIYSHLEL